jgi:peptidoglycan/LPS O-acetylase OafA/YrhL
MTLAYVWLATDRFVFIVLAGLVTLALAALSWFLVEQPALRLRHRPAAEQSDTLEARAGAL